FRGNLSQEAEIYLASDANWQTETIQRWTIFQPSNPVYVAAIKPVTAEDVSAIVKIAAQRNISYLATGGGHGLPISLGQVDDGISIDLSNFKTVDMDTNSETVTVGGGALFSDVIPPVLNAGYEIVTGACSCVGMTGATVGGGVARLQGLHGLIADTVVSYKLVTAAGDIVTASDSQNADLFWAMRGAGQNFAIVLETTYKIFKATNGGKALNVDLIFPASANATHWKLIKKLSIDMPAELSMFTGIQYSDQYGGLSLLFNAVYYGPESTGRRLLAPIIANNPLVTEINYINAIDVIPTSLFGRFNDPMCKKSNHVSTYTVGLKQIDIPTVNTLFHDMADFWGKYPQTRGSTIYYETLPVQAVKAVPSGSNSYPSSHREIETHVLMTYNYNDASIDAAVSDFADASRQKLVKTSGFPELELYTTYAHGDEGAQAWYRDSLPRLQALKKKYDPENRFRFFNPI
ncbi:hypothetical protein BKA66DRAFT_377034, partial [Pyrenochaeta sp. MPI-SDFR-AT-0127]